MVTHNKRNVEARRKRVLLRHEKRIEALKLRQIQAHDKKMKAEYAREIERLETECTTLRTRLHIVTPL